MTDLQKVKHAQRLIETALEAAQWTIDNPWGSSYMTTVKMNGESAALWLMEVCEIL